MKDDILLIIFFILKIFYNILAHVILYACVPSFGWFLGLGSCAHMLVISSSSWKTKQELLARLFFCLRMLTRVCARARVHVRADRIENNLNLFAQSSFYSHSSIFQLIHYFNRIDPRIEDHSRVPTYYDQTFFFLSFWELNEISILSRKIN